MTYYNARHGYGRTQTRLAAGDVASDHRFADSWEPFVLSAAESAAVRSRVRRFCRTVRQLLRETRGRPSFAFNLGRWMRTLFGIGTPRALEGRAKAVGVLLSTLLRLGYEAIASIRDHRVSPGPLARSPNDLATCA